MGGGGNEGGSLCFQTGDHISLWMLDDTERKQKA